MLERKHSHMSSDRRVKLQGRSVRGYHPSRFKIPLCQVAAAKEMKPDTVLILENTMPTNRVLTVIRDPSSFHEGTQTDTPLSLSPLILFIH